jgi:hypothetical protein
MNSKRHGRPKRQIALPPENLHGVGPATATALLAPLNLPLGPGFVASLGRQTNGPKIRGKMWTKWGPNGKDVMGQMGINLQLVDVSYPCSEGWEGHELASSPHHACRKGCSDSFRRGIVRLSVIFRGKWSHPRPKEKGASTTK